MKRLFVLGLTAAMLISALSACAVNQTAPTEMPTQPTIITELTETLPPVTEPPTEPPTEPTIPPLAEAGISIRYNIPYIIRPADWNASPVFHKNLDTRVSILKLHPGITRQVVRSIICSPDPRAVIIETYGAGNAPSKDWFISLVKEAAESGKILLNVTQCIAGSVNMDIYATGKTLKLAGVADGYDSTTESALAKLFHLMGKSGCNEEVRKGLEINLRGEISK